MFALFNWLSRPAARPAPAPRRRRPALEVLEDRSVPAALTASLPGFIGPLAGDVRTAQPQPPGQEAPQFTTEVVVRNLARPTGIFVRDGIAYVTLVPTPGVGGGQNTVEMIDLETGARRVLHMGEPEPTNIVRSRDGTLYWTCTSAGVILSQTPEQAATNAVSLVRGGLDRPVGIALTPDGRSLYWTEVPGGGSPSSIHRLDLRTDEEVVVHQGAGEPADLAFDRNGTLYFTDRSAGQIVKVARDGTATVVLSGLDQPVGLAIDHTGRNLYFTEVPTPGISGGNGGRNTVNVFNLLSGVRTIIDAGDPQPTDLWVDRDGSVYWTCTSAGVIVEATPMRR